MGLKGDIAEVKAAWSQSPWWMKAWLCLSAYLAMSSIASLAETVVKWKGFILDAINFYRRCISFPIKDLLRPLGLHLSEFQVDLLIIYILVLASMVRTLIVMTRELPGTRRLKFVPLMTIYYVILIFVVILISSFWSVKLLETLPFHVLIAILFPLLYHFPLMWATRSEKEIGKKVTKFCNQIYILYLVQMGSSVVVLCILAAINKGLYG